VHEGIRVEFRADLFNVANHTNFWLFNGADVLSTMAPCAPRDAMGNIIGAFRHCAGTGIAGLDMFNGLYYGTNGQVLTLSDLQHGRVSNDLTNPVFNGLGDPGGADIPRQGQLSVKVTW
jgi:hypothetical protein